MVTVWSASSSLYLLPDLRSALILVACNRQQDLARTLTRLSAAAHRRPTLQRWWGYCGAISTSSNAFADYNIMPSKEKKNNRSGRRPYFKASLAALQQRIQELEDVGVGATYP
ncbi:hypothetical protein B0H14DRAFT_3429189 [Mycena olivaceomarginata]|nr:hypothetical protein B0H14DRAFT_3429189 [Mycena olivaceomarginata]